VPCTRSHGLQTMPPTLVSTVVATIGVSHRHILTPMQPIPRSMEISALWEAAPLALTGVETAEDGEALALR